MYFTNVPYTLNDYSTKKKLIGDKSTEGRLFRLQNGAMNTVQNFYGGYYEKNTTEKNSVHTALCRVRGGGYCVPSKVTGRTNFFR